MQPNEAIPFPLYCLYLDKYDLRQYIGDLSGLFMSLISVWPEYWNSAVKVMYERKRKRRGVE